MQERMPIARDGLIGKWSVHDVTQTFENIDTSNISKTLDSLESGVVPLDHILHGTASSGAILPSIHVEILASGEMKMSIVQSMWPNMPATMNLNATIKWELKSDRMATQAVMDTLDAKIALDADHRLPAGELAGLVQRIPEIEADTLQKMKSSPQWMKSNLVSILYCGKRCFLTKSAEGSLMLHFRNP
jgi:hypothetical protein